MQLTKGAIGNLINRYKAVLKKCHLMNTFGSLAVAGMLVMGGAGVAGAVSAEDFSNKEITGKTLNSDASYLMGGYIQSSGKELDEAKFLKNTIIHTGKYLQGGIIKRSSYAPELSIANSEFSGNTVSTAGYLQGGIINHDVVKKTTNITKSKFNDNTILTTRSYFQGGIINNNGGTIKINNSEFNNNNMKSSNYLQGGIINNNGINESVVVYIENAKFNNNTINSKGFVQGGIIINDSISGTSSIDIVKSEFANNKINSQGSVTGGIILNDCMSTGDYLIAIDNTVFSKNEIHSERNLHGSIINNKKDHKVTINSSSFESNISIVKGDYALGGAIYNEGELTFTGNNTFTDNIINDKPNDIHNSGNVTVTSGTTTLGSGYSQDKGRLTVKGGAALESLGTMEITGGSVAFEDNSLFAVNGNNLTGNNAAISLSGDASMTVDDTARLRINNAKNGQTYTIVNDDSNTPTNSVWTGNIEASSDMLDMTVDQDGNVTAEAKDASEVFTGMDGDTAAIVNGLYGKGLNNTDADAMGVRFLSRATDNRFLGADKDAAAATIESAARIAFAGAVPQMTKMASDAGSNAVVNRLGFANPADGAQAMDAEGKIVDRNTTGFALWIAPLWQSQHGWGMEADNLDYGFNGNLGGVSLGADYTFENAIRAGITFNIGGGYAESSGGDLNSTENRMSFWGLGAYAGWNYENFGLMADVSYTSTWNDLKQDMDSRMGMGDLEADVQASAISAGLRAEYKLETSVLDVIPHIGVRYMSLNTWGFDAESNGGTVLEGDGFHQDIWTFPVGVTFTKDFTQDSGWSFKPSIDFSVIPAAGDIKAKQDVAFTGLPGSYEVETQMMDYLTWQGGVGLEMGNDTMSFGVNYTLQAGQHTTGHGVFGSFRYEF